MARTKAAAAPATESIEAMRLGAGFDDRAAACAHPDADGLDVKTLGKAEDSEPGLTQRSLAKVARVVRRPLPAVAAAYFAGLAKKGAA